MTDECADFLDVMWRGHTFTIRDFPFQQLRDKTPQALSGMKCCECGTGRGLTVMQMWRCSVCPESIGLLDAYCKPCRGSWEAATTAGGSTVLYRIFDAADALLYVGISSGALTRFSEHGKTKAWWGQTDHITIDHFDSRPEALIAERLAIIQEKPLYNIQHAK